jgi:molybdopterin/thiamine biosynthesis adenylyltransferase/rhodanese-related sulfurtransferase/molybdopterin converting factor small subunit
MPLRVFTGGADEVAVQGATVGEALRALGRTNEGLLPRILTPEGRIRSFVNVFLGEDNVNTLQGLNTLLKTDDVLSIIPAVAGGAGTRARERLLALRNAIQEVSPSEALALQQRGAALVDVREQDEIAQGSPPDALRIGRGFLELRIEEAVPELGRPLVVMCNGGNRSLFAAEDLKRLGYQNVFSVTGGFSRWKNEGLPFEVPKTLDRDARERYSRHLLMPEVGEAGQMKLLNSRVLLVGAGGLGSPAALYLAAAGVGTLGIVDHDVVDRSNLQRQVLHTDARVGMSKVESARVTLLALNPSLTVEGYKTRLDSRNVEDLFSGYDVVVDGSDNFATRYLVNDACVKLGIPNVHGAIFRFEGQVSVFWPGYERFAGPCYRCIYPEPPPPELAPSCAEVGVLGVLPGVIGLLQAVEVVKLVLGVGEPLIGRMLYYDALYARFTELKLVRDPGCRYCGDEAEFPGYVDYEEFCNAGTA